MDSEKNSWLIEEMRRYYAIGGGAYLTMKQNDKDKIIPAVKKPTAPFTLIQKNVLNKIVRSVDSVWQSSEVSDNFSKFTLLRCAYIQKHGVGFITETMLPFDMKHFVFAIRHINVLYANQIFPSVISAYHNYLLTIPKNKIFEVMFTPAELNNMRKIIEGMMSDINIMPSNELFPQLLMMCHLYMKNKPEERDIAEDFNFREQKIVERGAILWALSIA